MHIEVVYALPQRQERIALDLAPGSTVRDAMPARGLLPRRRQSEAGRSGGWGPIVGPQTRLHDHDRVEIYRPLLADPKEIRRTRAAKARP